MMKEAKEAKAAQSTVTQSTEANRTCGAVYGAGLRCGQGGVPRFSNPYPASDWRSSVWFEGYDAGRAQASKQGL